MAINPSIISRVCKLSCCAILSLLARITLAEPPNETATLPKELSTRGKMIYEASCADCHGDAGQGVNGAYDKALTGDLSLNQLAQLISETMPEGDPGTCVGEDALAVAAFIQDAFYSEAAQVRNRPPQLMLTRLTAEQTRQSVADIYASLDWIPRPKTENTDATGSVGEEGEAAGDSNFYGRGGGLTGTYFKSANRASENKVLERIDPVIHFDFGKESPGLDMPPDNFAIHWRGGLKVDVSGRYEIVIRSTCSFVSQLGRYDRALIDNHVQSGDATEFRREFFLTAGRVYPFQLTFTQRSRKTELPPASISVSWVPPGGAEQLIPPHNWLSDWLPPAFSLQTHWPPDDRSYGYQRGISVDRDWDEALTGTATEFAHSVAGELWPDYRRKHKDSEVQGRDLLRQFLRELMSIAFRHPMDDDLAAIFIDKQLQLEEDDSEAIKRVVLLGLKSPRFLYPYADSNRTPSEKAGTRLALILLDSLPIDPKLRNAMKDGQLETEEQIRSMAQHLLGDYRARAKTRSMLTQWLNIEHARDMSKQPEQFVDFDAHLVSDLRASLDAFLETILWSGSSDYRQFFSADWSYTSPRMEQFYGTAWSPLEPFPPQPEIVVAPGVEASEMAIAEQADGEAASETSETPEASVPPPEPPTPVPSPAFVGLRRTDSHPLRHGVLTHPYLMSRLAYHDTTSPIHRGVFLTRYILGRVLQPPQEAFTPFSPDLHPDLTTRQRVDLQTSPENCQTCHSRINGLGYSLEHFDAAGRWREKDRDQPIDTSGSYITRDGEEIQWNGVVDLANYLVRSRDAHEAFVRRAFHHFAQQPPAAYGEDTLKNLTDRFIENGFHVRELIVDIAVTAAQQPSTSTPSP